MTNGNFKWPGGKIAMILLCWTTGGIADELPAPSGGAIVAPDARLEWLFSRTADVEGGLTEGPAVAPDGTIYFSDIRRGGERGVIHRFDPKTGATTVFAADSGKSNGLIFTADGSLLACEGADHGGRRISRWNVRTRTRQTIAAGYDGKQFNSPNDICLDAVGRIYFSDPRYIGDEPRELETQAVYRIDPDGSLHEATHQVTKPNGVAISPDGQTLYVANHDNGTDRIDPTAPPPPRGAMKIYAFRIRSDGALGERRVFFDFGDRPGCDGMTVDEQGHLYLTGRDPQRPGVIVLDSQGREVAFIPTGPAGQSSDSPRGLPSNVEFGLGSEINVLYVTIDTGLYRIQLLVNGYHRQYLAAR